MSVDNERKTPSTRARSAGNTMERLFIGLTAFLYRLSGGAIGGKMGKGPVLLLTTKGRKSGKQRVTPLIYVLDANDLVIIASHGGAPTHPAWWLNLRSDPHAEVQVRREKVRVEAREATQEERERLWPKAVAVWPAYDDYQKRTTRTIPVVILQPVDKVTLT